MAFGAGGGRPDEVKGDINVTRWSTFACPPDHLHGRYTDASAGVDVMLPQGPHAEKKPGEEEISPFRSSPTAPSSSGRTGFRTRLVPLSPG